MFDVASLLLDFTNGIVARRQRVMRAYVGAQG